MKTVQLSQKQAQQFAATIFADIEAYVRDHQAEYEAFLKEELHAQIGGEN